MIGMDRLVAMLRAAGDPMRLCFLLLLRQAELTVSELSVIVGQSQPRVSRHLKLLCDAGLLERFKEGSWVFYRAADSGRGGELGQTLSTLAGHAPAMAEAALHRLAAVRDRLMRNNIAQCQVRWGDTYRLPFPDGGALTGFDAVLFHQVLHYLDDPGAAVAEAARVMRAGGRLLIADFASHDLEFLRSDFAHRRLGFSDREVQGWFQAAGLKPVASEAFAPH